VEDAIEQTTTPTCTHRHFGFLKVTKTPRVETEKPRCILSPGCNVLPSSRKDYSGALIPSTRISLQPVSCSCCPTTRELAVSGCISQAMSPMSTW